MYTYVYLECINPEKNHNKFYTIWLEPDFFSPTIVRSWGRIGTHKPHYLRRSYSTWNEAEKEIKRIIHKRIRHKYRIIKKLFC